MCVFKENALLHGFVVLSKKKCILSEVFIYPKSISSTRCCHDFLQGIIFWNVFVCRKHVVALVLVTCIKARISNSSNLSLSDFCTCIIISGERRKHLLLINTKTAETRRRWVILWCGRIKLHAPASQTPNYIPRKEKMKISWWKMKNRSSPKFRLKTQGF